MPKQKTKSKPVNLRPLTRLRARTNSLTAKKVQRRNSTGNINFREQSNTESSLESNKRLSVMETSVATLHTSVEEVKAMIAAMTSQNNRSNNDQEETDNVNIEHNNPDLDHNVEETPQEEIQDLNIGRPAIQSDVSYTGGLLIGQHLPKKLKEAIWYNRYVDFSVILDPEIEDAYSLAISTIGKNPTLNLLPKRKKNLTEREWCNAFDIYLAVYTTKFPNQLQMMLTYGQFIKRMMARNEDWAYYDHHFRLSREHSLCCWTTIRIDLQLTAQTRRKFRIQQNTGIPKGFCFRFHTKEARCDYNTQCRYKHCLLYTSPSPRDKRQSRMPSSA